MTTQVVIPYGGGDEHRARALDWVRARWELFGWPVTVGVCDGPTWCKAEAVNPIVEASTADVIVVADADSFTTPQSFLHAVHVVGHGGVLWAQPAAHVRRLDPPATDAALGCDPMVVEPPVTTGRSHQLLAGGGIVVVARSAWDAVGGFDARFQGWGGEDYALGCALRCHTGSYVYQAPGTLWHLWHPPAPSNGGLLPEGNARLASRYRQAKHDPAMLRQLVAENKENAWR